jgi:hypothetical protein
MISNIDLPQIKLFRVIIFETTIPLASSTSWLIKSFWLMQSLDFEPLIWNLRLAH